MRELCLSFGWMKFSSTSVILLTFDLVGCESFSTFFPELSSKTDGVRLSLVLQSENKPIFFRVLMQSPDSSISIFPPAVRETSWSLASSFARKFCGEKLLFFLMKFFKNSDISCGNLRSRSICNGLQGSFVEFGVKSVEGC